MKIVVTGAGGFIGSHLVKYLVNKGHWVRGVDIKLPTFEETKANEFICLDLRNKQNCEEVITKDINHVYALAANMGGIGYIEEHKAEIVKDNTLISINTLEAARLANVQNYLFSSSACIYPTYKQNTNTLSPLKEEDAYPAMPEDGYGWEKLYTERLCRHYREDFGLDTRIVRFHNIFGPQGTWQGGKEKSPAALCRKIAMANDGNEIEIWGDGNQTRSYCYIDDCVEGIYRLMNSECTEPLNLGQDRMLSINELVDIIANIAGKTISKKYDLTKPVGVRGRNSDNTKLKEVLGWEPNISLERGLSITYTWIYDQIYKESII